MTESDFLDDAQVRGFIDSWARIAPPEDFDGAGPCASESGDIAGVALAEAGLARLLITVCMPNSRYVPGGVNAVSPFGLLVPQHYVWRAQSMATGNWGETCRTLSGLSVDLRTAATSGDANLSLAECGRALRWGGDRNSNVGAWRLLRGLGCGLPAYLLRSEHELRLATARLNPDGSHRSVVQMNSMLSKVHSLMAMDGLPIYDSRVAGAISTIVETSRRFRGQGGPLSPCLTFPSVAGGRRSVLARYPDARNPGLLSYGVKQASANWAGATVRLGWLLKAMLGGCPAPGQMRWLEASLFVAGHDVRGINWPAPASARRAAPLHLCNSDPTPWRRHRQLASDTREGPQSLTQKGGR